MKKIGEQFALVQHGKGGKQQFAMGFLLAIGRTIDNEEGAKKVREVERKVREREKKVREREKKARGITRRGT